MRTQQERSQQQSTVRPQKKQHLLMHDLITVLYQPLEPCHALSEAHVFGCVVHTGGVEFLRV